MNWPNDRTRAARLFALAGTMVIAALITPRSATAEERRFAVMLAHSPKSFGGALPPRGLSDAEIIRKNYFDRNSSSIDSFAEYWEEISYGDVQVTGDVVGWVTIPWAFDPAPPNAPARPSPENFINLFQNRGVACDGAPGAPAGYAYGAGEEFCDCVGAGGSETAIGDDTCGALIIRQINGDPTPFSPPVREKGLVDFDAVGVSVWTPGERFVDVDDDGRWDGLDEKNDQMCHSPEGCPDRADGTEVECTGGGKVGPCGCDFRGCGDLPIPGIDLDRDGQLLNCTDCVILDESAALPNCIPPPPGDSCGFQLPECCNQTDRDAQAACADGGGVTLEIKEGINCGTPLFCCEYDDVDGDNQVDVVEPFEDFIVRWNPNGTTPSNVWIPVTEDYIAANYPGDVVELQRRTGNGYYDPSDMFFDTGSTKMMQDAGQNQFAWRTPKPGARYSGSPNFETVWFDDWWAGRYGSTAPAWPGGSGRTPAFNSPIMRPFDPVQPNPPVVRGTAGRRWFRPDKGGWTGEGDGTADTPDLNFSSGTDQALFTVLPEETFGYYDGWVEHDDLASSKYHHAGDKRLGEITLPSADTVTPPGTSTGETYTAIFGADLGKNNPRGGATNKDPDNFCVAAGPGAVNIHGEKGFDAGDACLVEWLTWRTDGTSPTVARRWEIENGNYHPFAGPSSKLMGGPVGFRDYNLDGMIDQGEVRPELSENYSVDPNPFTNPNDGFSTDYPFNRRRLVEDVVEALDPSVNWADFEDRFNRVSGIVLVPPNAYSDPNLFPFSPSYFPIHTEDATGLKFHDLVICQSCRDFPAAVAYAAHEYLHTWEGYPDLYDYDVFNDPQTDVVNCPIGTWDIMAGGGERQGNTNTGLVHPMPFLKRGSGWVDPVDLRSLLTPGVETTLTLPPAELVRDNSYFFFSNEERAGEKYWFWSAGSGFDSRFPGSGMLIVHSDVGVDSNALPLQQRSEPFTYVVAQADGRRDLEACSSSGNPGDAGDPWPGTSNATRFAFDTVPSATWNTPSRWTGLDITNIVPDGAGSTQLTLSWVPTNIPGLRFVNPPGGSSSGGTYQINYDATDVRGGTTIRMYATQDKNNASVTAAGTLFVGQVNKRGRGTSRLSTDWRLTGVPDGQWFVFAKLIPGPGIDGVTERSATTPRGGRNNVGNGSATVQSVNVGTSDANTARFETWTAVCIKADGTEWRVNSALTQPEPPDNAADQDPFPHAITGQSYTSIGGEVRFVIRAGTTPFALGDTFTFTTTGITALSKGLLVFGERVTASPVAKITAQPLSGRPPLKVSFDAIESRDPQGEALQFEWNFGDGSPVQGGVSVNHTFTKSGIFTVVLTATNPRNRLFGQSAVDVNAINNSPNAKVSAAPASGRAPLQVRLSAADSSDTETPSTGLIYQWDFGDGRTGNDLGASGVLIQPTHTYSKRADGTSCTPTTVCTFTVGLTVTDEGGKQDTATTTITVGNSNPSAVVTASPLRGSAPLEVRFNAGGSTDADGDALTVDWVWGDGKETPNQPLAGEDGNGTVTHKYAAEGLYRPTATIKDPNGGSAVWPGVDITVTAPAAGSSDPRARFRICAQLPCRPTDPPMLVRNESFSVDASDSVDRPVGGSITAYSWNWGDGSPTDSGVTATHTYTTAGTFTITLTVSDNETPPNTGRFLRSVVVEEKGDGGEIQIENEPPVPFFVVDPPSGVASETEFRFDATGSNDPDGDNAKLTYEWEFGDKSADGAGRVVRHVYAAPNLSGYVVRLTVRDEKNASRSLTGVVIVTETSGNQRPVANIGTGPRAGSAPFTLSLDASNSFDPDGDPLEFRWEFREAGEVIDVLAGAKVSRVFAASGTFNVELRVSDGRGGVSFAGPQTIDVTPRVAPPVDVEPGQGVPIDNGPGAIPNSANQRSPLMCGLGMLMAMIGSLIGLTLMAASRRRRR